MSTTSQKSVCILLIITQAVSTVSATCDTSAVNAIKIITNDCSYPACSSEHTPLDTDLWRCVHDNTFCMSGELFISASDVLAAERVCSCKDILEYPSLIGTCITNGLYSPMLTDDDCTTGSSVCEKNDSNKFLGDTEHPFTACDLKCASQMSLPTNSSLEDIVNLSLEDVAKLKEPNEGSVDRKHEGISGGVLPGIVIGCILGALMILVGGKSYLERKPNYNKPKFFPVEGDII